MKFKMLQNSFVFGVYKNMTKNVMTEILCFLNENSENLKFAKR